MNQALTIATYEVRQRSRVFIVALAMATLPFISAATHKSDRGTVIAFIGGFLAMAIAAALAIAMGVTTVGRELFEKRLSFYFAKPLSAPAIWFGKLSSAMAVSLIAFFIVASPAWLAARESWNSLWSGDGVNVLVWVALGSLLLFLCSHIASSMVSSRSALIGLDFVMMVLAAGALAYTFAPLLSGGAHVVASRLLIAISVAVLVSLVAAPVWQLANGRTDARRSHVALSRALWFSIGAILLVAGTYVLWLTAAKPASVVRVAALAQSPNGDQVFLAGEAAHRGDYVAAFVVSPRDGSFKRLPWMRWSGVEYSRDGQTFAWTEFAGLPRPARMLSDECILHVQRLGASIDRLALRLSGVSEFALSTDGSRVAVARGAMVTVYDTSSGGLIGSIRTHGTTYGTRMFFVTPDSMRLVQFEPRNNSPMYLSTLTIEGRSLKASQELVVDAGGYSQATASADGSRWLLRRGSRLVDGNTGRVINQLDGAGNTPGGTILADGTCLLGVTTSSGTVLRVFDRDGQPQRDIPLPGVERAFISAALSADRVIAFARNGGKRSMLVIDVRRGVVERTVPDTFGPIRGWSTDPRLPEFHTAELAGIDQDGRVVMWNANTGARRPMF